MVEKQPQWVFKHWPQYNDRNTLDIISELRQIQRNTKFNSAVKAKVMGGHVLYNWLLNAERVANGTMKNPKKMLLYSSHDGTLLSLMYALGVANDRLVPYASSFIMEIYKNASNYEIELLFRNDTTKPPYPLTIAGCELPCSAEKMAKLYGDMLVINYDEQQACARTEVANLNEKFHTKLKSDGPSYFFVVKELDCDGNSALNSFDAL
uniref:Lysosomal acid phosphatase n=1 Tax=Angiostrongylus cantonensis TaxID=6313 RepID=A0A158P818_ANGCA